MHSAAALHPKLHALHAFRQAVPAKHRHAVHAGIHRRWPAPQCAVWPPLAPHLLLRHGQAGLDLALRLGLPEQGADGLQPRRLGSQRLRIRQRARACQLSGLLRLLPGGLRCGRCACCRQLRLPAVLRLIGFLSKGVIICQGPVCCRRSGLSSGLLLRARPLHCHLLGSLLLLLLLLPCPRRLSPALTRLFALLLLLLLLPHAALPLRSRRRRLLLLFGRWLRRRRPLAAAPGHSAAAGTAALFAAAPAAATPQRLCGSLLGITVAAAAAAAGFLLLLRGGSAAAALRRRLLPALPLRVLRPLLRLLLGLLLGHQVVLPRQGLPCLPCLDAGPGCLLHLLPHRRLAVGEDGIPRLAHAAVHPGQLKAVVGAAAGGVHDLRWSSRASVGGRVLGAAAFQTSRAHRPPGWWQRVRSMPAALCACSSAGVLASSNSQPLRRCVHRPPSPPPTRRRPAHLLKAVADLHAKPLGHQLYHLRVNQRLAGLHQHLRQGSRGCAGWPPPARGRPPGRRSLALP